MRVIIVNKRNTNWKSNKFYKAFDELEKENKLL